MADPFKMKKTLFKIGKAFIKHYGKDNCERSINLGKDCWETYSKYKKFKETNDTINQSAFKNQLHKDLMKYQGVLQELNKNKSEWQQNIVIEFKH